jgi:hypothetical protein
MDEKSAQYSEGERQAAGDAERACDPAHAFTRFSSALFFYMGAQRQAGCTLSL